MDKTARRRAEITDQEWREFVWVDVTSLEDTVRGPEHVYLPSHRRDDLVDKPCVACGMLRGEYDALGAKALYEMSLTARHTCGLPLAAAIS